MLGGLSSAIYNEVLQFFVILAGLIPLVIVGAEGGRRHRAACSSKLSHNGTFFTHPWSASRVGGGQPARRLDRHRLRPRRSACRSATGRPTSPRCSGRMSAKDDNAARRRRSSASFPKIFIPFADDHPGHGRGAADPGHRRAGGLTYNDAIPALMNKYLPNGVLGIASPACWPRSWPAWRPTSARSTPCSPTTSGRHYIRPGRPDRYYLQVGRYHHRRRRLHRHRHRVPRRAATATS